MSCTTTRTLTACNDEEVKNSILQVVRAMALHHDFMLTSTRTRPLPRGSRGSYSLSSSVIYNASATRRWRFGTIWVQFSAMLGTAPAWSGGNEGLSTEILRQRRFLTSYMYRTPPFLNPKPWAPNPTPYPKPQFVKKSTEGEDLGR